LHNQIAEAPCSFCTKIRNLAAFPRKPNFPFFRENDCNLLQNAAFSHFALSNALFILHKNPQSCGVSEKTELPDFPRKLLQFTAKRRFFAL